MDFGPARALERSASNSTLVYARASAERVRAAVVGQWSADSVSAPATGNHSCVALSLDGPGARDTAQVGLERCPKLLSLASEPRKPGTVVALRVLKKPVR